MKKIIDYILYLILLFFSGISLILTRKARTSFGKFIGVLIRLFLPGRIKVTIENLSKAFPDKSEDWIQDIMKKSFANLGIVLSEIIVFRYMSEKKIRKYLTLENPDIFFDCYSKGKGVILVSAHFGNWELNAFAGALFVNVPFLIIVENQRNSLINDKINEFRIKCGNKIVPKDKAAREIVREIKNGGVVALLADQSATEDRDIFVDFFGRKASTYEAPASLALKFGIPMICSFPVRQKDGTYLSSVVEVNHSDLEHNKEGIEQLTRRHVKILEDVIREYPEQWVWQHKRWKHQPK
jgi:Kdo2-lipid IVA lauroyltransferase/acyltransferase